MGRKNLLENDALNSKFSAEGENPHQAAFSEPKARGLALMKDELQVEPKKKKRLNVKQH